MRMRAVAYSWDVWADEDFSTRYCGSITFDGERYRVRDLNGNATGDHYATRSGAMAALKRRLTNSRPAGDAGPCVGEDAPHALPS